jgi:hypothetical protein
MEATPVRIQYLAFDESSLSTARIDAAGLETVADHRWFFLINLVSADAK